METENPDLDPTLVAAGSARSAFDRSGLSQRYELLGEAGRGGMGVVYHGRHRLLGQPVAVKLHSVRHDVDRFQREARILASIRSPHVVPVHDFEILPDGQAMLVMAWIEGQHLGQVLQESAAVDEARLVRWMVQVCEGMQTAANQGIVHRDLKPSNILVDSSDRAYVADFGLARSAEVEALTQTGGVLGTPHYMAPEQAEDPRTVDTRADIYSFGATFYHVATRQKPFAGDSWFAILLNHKTAPLVAPKSRNPALSDRVNDCLERCLAKSPRDRFQSFREIAAHLQPAAGRAEPWDASEDEMILPQLEHFRARRALYLSGDRSALPQPDAYSFPNQRVCTIGFGDLAAQQVDALVSSDDEMLSMGGGVSDRLCSVGGAEYARIAQRFAPVRPGRAVATPAGKLPARFVLHGVTMGRLGAERVRPSRDLLNEIMESCFYHADSLGLRSLAFPLLGTGVGQFSREVCLDMMFHFLARRLARGVTIVNEVRIVLYAPRFE